MAGSVPRIPQAGGRLPPPQAGGRLPRIGDAAKTAWIDLYRAFAALTGVWPIALAISVALSLVPTVLTGPGPHGAGAQIVSFLTSVADAFFLTPFIIAVHRFIIRDEIAPRYRLRPREPRFQKFFGWSLILLASTSVLEIFPLFVSLLAARGGAAPIIFIVGFIFTFVVLLTWAWLRLSILFPAIAVDAPRANWRSVMADTRGCAWQIFLIMLLASLPFVVLAILFVATGVGRETVAIDVIGAVLGLPWTTLWVVIASRLYQRLGYRVN